MPLIANVTTNSTFDQWRTRTNESITELNSNVLKFDTTPNANASVNGVVSAVTLRANLSVNTLLLSVTGNASFTGANLVVQGTNTAISSNVVLSGANVDISGVVRIGGAVSVAGLFDVAANAAFNAHITTVGTATIGSALQVGGPLYYGDLTVITPPVLSANVTTWTPPGHGDAVVIRANSSANVTINSLTCVDPSRGRFVYVENIGSLSFYLGHQIEGGTLANDRFITPDGQPYEIRSRTGAHLWYDKTSLRWRILSSVTPLPTTAAFAALSATSFGATTGAIVTLSANTIAANSASLVNLGTTGIVTLSGQVSLPSALGVLFGGVSQDSYQYTPTSMWVNIDSDNNDGNATWTLGRGRSNATAGMTMMRVNSAQVFCNTASLLVNGSVQGTQFVGTTFWNTIAGRPGLMISTGGDLASDQNLRTVDNPIFGSLTLTTTAGNWLNGPSAGANSTHFVGTNILVVQALTVGAASQFNTNLNILGALTVGGSTQVGSLLSLGNVQGNSLLVGAGGATIFGNINVTGTKNFAIPHPLKVLREAGVELRHTAIEGPYCDLLYRGVAKLSNGTVAINLDVHSRMHEGTFVALTQRVQAFAQNVDGWAPVRASVEGNQLLIVCQDATSTAAVAWMVVAERADETLRKLPTTDADGRFVTETLASTYQELTDSAHGERCADPWCHVDLPEQPPPVAIEEPVAPRRRTKKKQ